MDYNSQYLCLQHSGLVESIKSLCLKIDEREKFVNSKFESMERSVNVARVEMDRRLEGMNEFRAQLDKQVVTFPTRTELVSEIGKLQVQIHSNVLALDDIKETIARQTGARKWSDYVAMALVSGAIFALMRFIFHV